MTSARRLEDKVGIVTGAASGIGRATALAAAREGATVLVADLASARGEACETVAMIEREGGTAVALDCDVAVAADHSRLVSDALERFGRLDFAHNNAGVELEASVTDTDEAAFDAVIAVNLKGVWLGMKHQIPPMLEAGGGAIVNTASLAGLVGAPALAAYTASKHGVVGLTRSAAIDYAEGGVRVNAVCPAGIRTPMMESVDAERQATLLAPHLIKRLGTPAEVAAAVIWLLSDEASFVTGTALPVDAGASAH